MAKRDSLTASQLREALHYEPTTGVFTWREGRKGVAHAGSVAGGKNKRGYWRVCVNGTRQNGNVLAWLYMTGRWPSLDVDHENGQRWDNRWDNLREVTRGVNNQNQRKPHKRNKSGFLGVSPNRNRWAASIAVDLVKTHLGTFDTPEQAHAVYIAAKREMHVGCTI